MKRKQQPQYVPPKPPPPDRIAEEFIALATAAMDARRNSKDEVVRAQELLKFELALNQLALWVKFGIVPGQ